MLRVAFNNHRIEYKEKHLLEERLSNLLKPTVFHNLLELEPQIKEDIPITDIAINNTLQEGKRLLIVTNPNCRNCAKVHPYIKELSANIPMSLVLIFSDEVGKAVSRTILTAYLQEGWDKAMQLLEEWFEKHEIKEADKYPTTDAAEEIMRKQVMYCWKQNINQTPSAIINRHYVPKVYSFSNLRYVLT